MKSHKDYAEYWYQNLLTARNDTERKLCQRQLNHFVNLLGMETWKPMRDRIRQKVKDGKETKTFSF